MRRRRAITLLAVYVAVLAGLGLRGLAPTDRDIGLLGREFGGWSMYGSAISEVDVVATVDGEEVAVEGLWHSALIHSATPRLPPELLERYAAWLHERHELTDDDRVRVVVTYRRDDGPLETVEAAHP